MTIGQYDIFASPVDCPSKDRDLADYHQLHDNDFGMRCPVLPVLPPHNLSVLLNADLCRKRDPWGIMCGIMRLMASLRDVQLRIYSSEGDYSTVLLEGNWRMWGGERMRMDLDRILDNLLSKMLEGEDWRQSIDIRVDDEGKRCVGNIILTKRS